MKKARTDKHMLKEQSGCHSITSGDVTAVEYGTGQVLGDYFLMYSVVIIVVVLSVSQIIYK